MGTETSMLLGLGPLISGIALAMLGYLLARDVDGLARRNAEHVLRLAVGHPGRPTHSPPGHWMSLSPESQLRSLELRARSFGRVFLILGLTFAGVGMADLGHLLAATA